MLLALANAAAPRQRVQQRLVNTRVERSKLEPRLEIAEDLVVRNACGQVLQQRDVAAAKTAPLSDEPAVEDRVAVDLQPFEKVAGEQRGQRSQPLRSERLDALLGRAGDLDRIDEAVRQVEPDGVGGGVHPLPAGLVDDAPDLAETPAQLAARIVRDIPQQLAKLAARDGTRGERQIGDERAHLARCRQRQRDALAADRHRPEQPDMQRRGAAGPARPIRFHGHFHAGYHARLHAWPLRLRSRSRRGVASDRPPPWHGPREARQEQPPERRTIMVTSAAAVESKPAGRPNRSRSVPRDRDHPHDASLTSDATGKGLNP